MTIVIMNNYDYFDQEILRTNFTLRQVLSVPVLIFVVDKICDKVSF